MGISDDTGVMVFAGLIGVLIVGFGAICEGVVVVETLGVCAGREKQYNGLWSR